MTILEALKSVTNYPIPEAALTRLALVRGFDASQEATAETMQSKSYRVTEADVMSWVAKAPNISEGGVSFNLSESDRKRLQAEADSILAQEGVARPSIYGYKGENL